MTAPDPPKCRTCGRPIYGVPLDATRYGKGWVHVRSNREACPPPHRALAEPPTLDDVDAKRAAARR